MRSFILPVFLGLCVSACSSSSDDSGANMGASSGTDFRVATFIVEFPGRGIPATITELDYDSAGRIQTISRSSVGSLDEPSISTYTYNEFGIQTRTDGDKTETFSYVDGNISQIMSTLGETISYTYDNEGKLISFLGDLFDADDDCDSAFVPIGGVGSGDDSTVDSTPVFEIAYTGDRLDSITGSSGDVDLFEYDQQGLLVRQTSTGACDNSVSDFTYRADGLPLRATSRNTEFESETQEVVYIYSGDQLTELVSIDRDDDFGFLETNTVSYNYNASGRLVGVTIVDEFSFNGDNEISTVNLALTYEEEGCVGQLTAYPEVILQTSLVNAPDQSNFNLDCTYIPDGF